MHVYWLLYRPIFALADSKKTAILFKITLNLDNLFNSQYRDCIMKWISLVGLLIYSSVSAMAHCFAVAGPLRTESAHHSNRTNTLGSEPLRTI